MKTISIRWTEDQHELIKRLRDEGINLSILMRGLFDEWVVIREDLISPAERKLTLIRQIDRIDTELNKLKIDEGYLTMKHAKPKEEGDGSTLLDKVTELYYLAEDEDGYVRVHNHTRGQQLIHGDNELFIEQSHRDGSWTFKSWQVLISARIQGGLREEHIDMLINIAAMNSAAVTNPYQIKRSEAIGERIGELSVKQEALKVLLI